MLAALAPYAVRRCSLSLTRSRYRATTWAGARSGRPDRMLAAVLLHASFRPRLAATPLRFADPSPPSGWIEDFHLQAVDHARHTREARREAGPEFVTEHRGVRLVPESRSLQRHGHQGESEMALDGAHRAGRTEFAMVPLA